MKTAAWFFFFSSRRRHTRSLRDWSSDVCSSDLEMLWPERPTDRSRANLRSAIWRMPRSGREIVEELGDCLALADRVDVDLRALVARCRRLFEHPDELADHPAEVTGYDDLLHDLLPTWDEEWVIVERSRIRQLRLHALEALSAVHTGAGRYGPAVR